jgi:LL-diaminopimelate aminotransferase
MGRFEEGVFSSLLAVKNERLAAGRPVFDLSVGTPDIPPGKHIIDALSREVRDPGNYIYAIGDLPELREAAASWYARRYGVDLDPKTEICSLLGSQEGLSHIALPLVDEGDTVLVPDPF